MYRIYVCIIVYNIYIMYTVYNMDMKHTWKEQLIGLKYLEFSPWLASWISRGSNQGYRMARVARRERWHWKTFLLLKLRMFSIVSFSLHVICIIKYNPPREFTLLCKAHQFAVCPAVPRGLRWNHNSRILLDSLPSMSLVLTVLRMEKGQEPDVQSQVSGGWLHHVVFLTLRKAMS